MANLKIPNHRWLGILSLREPVCLTLHPVCWTKIPVRSWNGAKNRVVGIIAALQPDQKECL
jgi:hypothetical protein